MNKNKAYKVSVFNADNEAFKLFAIVRQLSLKVPQAYMKYILK